MLETTELRPFLTRIGGRMGGNGSRPGLPPFYRVKTAWHGVKLQKCAKRWVIPVTFSGVEALHNRRTFLEEGFCPEVHDADQPATRKTAAN
jgi:hypothetical protein